MNIRKKILMLCKITADFSQNYKNLTYIKYAKNELACTRTLKVLAPSETQNIAVTLGWLIY